MHMHFSNNNNLSSSVRQAGSAVRRCRESVVFSISSEPVTAPGWRRPRIRRMRVLRFPASFSE